MQATESYFATCAPGVESYLQRELQALRFARVERQVGGCYFEGDISAGWRANLELRTAIRVLRRLARFDAPDEDRLYDAVYELPWERFLAPDGRLRVDARARDSALTHTRFLEQRVKDAIVDRFRARYGRRPDVDKEDPDLRVDLHLYRDRAILALDMSGESLHRRGWRLHQGRAPLAETTVAALLFASGWDRRSPLIDPFCGSATIAIEAALLAGDIAPGRFRKSYGFERWLDHDPAGFGRMASEIRARGSVPRKLQLLASDYDERCVHDAQENAAAAGVSEHLIIEHADAREFTPRRGWNAFVLTNPPYGERVGQFDELVELYREFGQCLRDKAQGYELALLTSEPSLWKAAALKAHGQIEIRNGALECRLYQASIGDSSGLKPDSADPRGPGASDRRSRRRSHRR